MTSGKPLTDREKRFIKMHCKGLFASQIARQLEIRFPKDNGGFRDSQSINRYIRSLSAD